MRRKCHVTWQRMKPGKPHFRLPDSRERLDRALPKRWSTYLRESDLKEFPNQGFGKKMPKFGSLLLIVATLLGRLHLSFSLPHGERHDIACRGVYQHDCAFEALLLLGLWQD